VSGYQAACPSCGATLVFQLGVSLLRVCEHCGVAVARKGANLESHGRLAALMPTPSVLKLGLEGRYAGAPPFALVGRLQIDHGTGTWDEWLMAFRDGQWAWLSESQGKFHYLGLAPLPAVPAFEQIRVGQRLDLGAPGTFVVSEARTGRFVSAQGELPFDVAPGSALRYADLSGPGGAFATLDYGAGPVAQALYVGREVSLEELGLREIASEQERRKRAGGEALACPRCGGPLEVRAPDQTRRVACPYCGSLLDATRDLAVLEALDRVPVKPLLPLGSTGRLAGGEWTVIGFMQRSVEVEGIRYPWREYLLYEPRKGFRWLVESSGHWSFVEPVHAGDVEERGGGVRYRGALFRHFQSAQARVDHVVGEFYWAVARGDKVQTHDYVAPPLSLSNEATPEESLWSLGRYQEPEELWSAFRAPGSPPERQGVAPGQPWPHARDARSINRSALLFLALLGLLFAGLVAAGGERIHAQSLSLPPQAAPGAPEAVAFSERFFVQRHGNLEVRARAPVDNSWLYLDGALINEETGAVDEFDLEVSYYHGTDGDGAWSEGGSEARAYLASVPPGRYVLRLAPSWQPGQAPSGYDVTVRSRVPRLYQLLLAALAVAAWPIALAWKRFRFEMQRWSESDHPWISADE
jgi:hypothetical protein